MQQLQLPGQNLSFLREQGSQGVMPGQEIIISLYSFRMVALSRLAALLFLLLGYVLLLFSFRQAYSVFGSELL